MQLPAKRQKRPWEEEAEIVQRDTEIWERLDSGPCDGKTAYSAFLMGHNKVQWLEVESNKFIIELCPYFSKQGENCSADSLLLEGEIGYLSKRHALMQDRSLSVCVGRWVRPDDCT